MVSSYVKTIFRTIKSRLAQFLAIAGIMALSVGFVTGLGATATNMLDSVNDYLVDSSVSDIIIKTENGITESQKESIYNDTDVTAYSEFFTYDTQLDRGITRVYISDLSGNEINKLELIEGEFPSSMTEIIVERSDKNLAEVFIGDEVVYNGLTLNVVGICANPLYFSKESELAIVKDSTEDIYLENIIYIDSQYFPMPLVTDIYIKLNTSDMNVFSNKYKDIVSEKIDKFNGYSTTENPLHFLSLEENASAALLESNAEKLDIISLIFPIFFGLVSALVVLTTMTRMVEKDRMIIGCYKTLGYSNFKIGFKYFFFAALSCVIGAVVGFFAGFRSIPLVVVNVYSSMFHFPPLSYGFYYLFGLISSVAMILAVLLITVYAVVKTLKEKPSDLIKEKPPKKGKRILLERIGFIWKRLKFKYKSTMRNIFRNVKHLLMTVISVAGCVALVLAGLGLYDSMNAMKSADSANSPTLNSIMDSMIYVVFLLIIAAAVLSIIVVYNLTNLNIEERKREIATLRVLGYNNFEVSGYIYREIFILALMGIVVGLPIGYGLIFFILKFMDTGIFTIAISVEWYSFILAAVIIIIFVGVTMLLLYRKIVSIDMNESLKSVD